MPLSGDSKASEKFHRGYSFFSRARLSVVTFPGSLYLTTVPRRAVRPEGMKPLHTKVFLEAVGKASTTPEESPRTEQKRKG